MILPVLYLFAICLHRLPIIRGHLGTVTSISFLGPAVLVFFIFPWLVLISVNGSPLPDKLIPGVLERHFLQAVYFFKNGIVVSTRLEVDIPGPLSYFDIIKSIIYRLAYYWTPIRFGERPYSSVHNIVNGVYMLVSLPLMAIGVKQLLGMTKDRMLIALFLMMVVYSYALLHAVTLVSFDWRYQLPAMVPFWMLAGCGFCHFLENKMRRPLRGSWRNRQRNFVPETSS